MAKRLGKIKVLRSQRGAYRISIHGPRGNEVLITAKMHPSESSAIKSLWIAANVLKKYTNGYIDLINEIALPSKRRAKRKRIN
jgi:hypothetical protein